VLLLPADVHDVMSTAMANKAGSAFRGHAVVLEARLRPRMLRTNLPEMPASWDRTGDASEW
jgi:hypothetical protein